jgi:hypothetical protein
MANTLFTYMYRDGDNFKQIHAVVFAGGVTDDMRRRIMMAATLPHQSIDDDTEGFFIPGLVELPDLQNRFGAIEAKILDAMAPDMTDAMKATLEGLVERARLEKPQWNDERDHIWHEIIDIKQVNANPTVESTIEAFVTAMEGAIWTESYRPPFYDETVANFEEARKSSPELGAGY